MNDFTKDMLKSFGINVDKNSSKNKKSKSTEIDFPVFIKGDYDKVFLGTDNYYKTIVRVTPINADNLDKSDLKDIMECISIGLSTYPNRLQILIQTEQIDIEQNIKNIELYEQGINDELKLLLLDDKKKLLLDRKSEIKSVLNFYMVLEAKEKNKIVAEQLLEDYIGDISSEFESMGMFVEQLERDEVGENLYQRLNPSSYDLEPYQEEWKLNNILPESFTIFEDKTNLLIDRKYTRHFNLDYFPTTVGFRFLKKIFEYNGDLFFSMILNPKDKGIVIDQLNKSYSKYAEEKNKYNDKDKKRTMDATDKMKSSEKMMSEISSENVNLYDVCVTIGINGNTMEELNKNEKKLRAKISGTRCKTSVIDLEDADGFLCTLPVLARNKITNNFVWNMSSRNIGAMIPFDNTEYIEPDGTVIGNNLASKSLVICNAFAKIHDNPHICILAISGAGKSFWIGVNIIRDLPYRDYIIQFDLDGSANFPWANKVNFSPTSKFITNPFHIRNAILSSDDENVGKVNIGDFLAIKIMDLITFFKWIMKDLTPYAESLLEEDIRDTYKEVGLTFDSTELPELFPTFDTLDQVQKRKIKESENEKAKATREDINSTLNPYIGGTYSNMFNGQTNWDYSLHTILDIHSVPEAVIPPLYELLLKEVWQFCKKDGVLQDMIGRKSYKKVIIDELHLFADPKNPQTLKFVAQELIKQSRKFGIDVITATQNISDLTSIPRHGQAIIDNSNFKILFKLGQTDHEIAKKLFRLSDKEMKKVVIGRKIINTKDSNTNKHKGVGILIEGANKVMFKSFATPKELSIIDKAQYEELFNKRSEFVS
jgi:hypothetical protein